DRFMKRYAPNAMELASRDVVSRSEQTEIDAGRGINGSIYLDMRHLGAERIIERLPGSRELSMTFAGVDPIYDPVPVRPGAHYHMGGVECDNDGATALTGLYAAGEVACVSVHGANRLGGNSLMETITFGRRAGRAAAEWALANTTIDVPASAEADAERDLTQAIELGNMIELARCMLQAGLARKESRGAHARPYDFPTRDDEHFMKHSISTHTPDGPELSYRDVRYTKYDPMERKY